MSACFATGILVDNLATASRATLTLTGCSVWNNEADGIYQNLGGSLTLLNTTVSDSGWHNVNNRGVLTVINSTLSNGGAAGPSVFAGGIFNTGQMTMLNSTVSGTEGVGIFTEGVTGTATLTNCTVSGNSGDGIQAREGATVTLASTVVDGNCSRDMASDIFSGGYNIESPGDTGGFDQEGDQPSVSADDLNLAPLADNGGPTRTHALLPGSDAIDVIPKAMCVDADGEPLTEDQRAEARPAGSESKCDVGSFELQ